MEQSVNLDARRVLNILSSRIAVLMEENAILMAENEQLKQLIAQLQNQAKGKGPDSKDSDNA